MAQVTQVLFEVTGIQEYVFGSNQLAQNIGASELVYRATTEWLVQALHPLRHNGVIWDKKKFELTWDDHAGLDAEGLGAGYEVVLVYAAAGNAMLLFADPEQARAVVKRLSRKVLQDARGMQLVALVGEPFAWRDTALAKEHHRLRGELAARKRDRHHLTPLMGLGVTATCVFTGQPGIGYDNDVNVVGADAAQKAQTIAGVGQPKLISGEVADKLRAEDGGKKRLKAVLHQEMGERPDYEFVYDFGEFGTHGESSYIAVIHADGNGMGQRFGKIAEAYSHSDQNLDYVAALRKFSKSIAQQAQMALKETVKQLFACGDDKFFCRDIPVAKGENGKKRLPFRPIVFGGDDVTFVSDGRLGLSLAAYYLEQLQKGKLADDQPLYARAGVAVVKSHYPFARAYDLASDLADSAKKAINGLKGAGESEAPGLTTLDWHFATTGAIYGLKAIRKREYQEGKLLMRPLRLSTPVDETSQWRTWETFTALLKEFQENERGWAGRRNKLKALRDGLRGGASAVQLFLTNFGLDKLPAIPGQPDMAHYGWQGNQCGYFDAVEAIDLYLPLKPVQEQTP